MSEIQTVPEPTRSALETEILSAEKGLTKEQLARFMDVHDLTVFIYSKDNNGLDTTQMRKLCQVENFSPEVVFPGGGKQMMFSLMNIDPPQMGTLLRVFGKKVKSMVVSADPKYCQVFGNKFSLFFEVDR